MKTHDKGKRMLVSDMEHLKKLFIMPDSPDKFIEFGTELLDVIHSFFQEKGGIHSSISLPDLAKIFSNINIPKQPHLLKDVLTEIKSKITAHSVKVGNPYYIGHMTSAVPYFMILLEMIIAALNQNQVKIESAKASTFVEREFLAWMHRLVYDRDEKYYRANIQNRNIALGAVTLDGTLANLTALLVARNKAFPADGQFPGIREAGVYDAFKHYGVSRGVFIVSKRGHYSIDKVARLIGMGESSVIKIPVDIDNRIDIQRVEKVCEEIRQHNETSEEKIKIISIIGIAGSTETGNIDNLSELRRIANEQKTHFHVDAAWGGAVLLVDKYRYMFKGIEKADSVCIDAHKLLYTPVSMGMVVFRKKEEMNYLKHSANYIIRPDSVDLGRFNVEGSRGFSALKPWTTLKILGKDGFQFLFEHAHGLSSVLRGLVEMHCNFEPMNQPELFIFNYRFTPKKVRERLDALLLVIRDRDPDKVKREIDQIYQINEVLNDLNIELHKALREEDDSFVSRTMLDVPRYLYQNVVILRAVTVNPLTTPEVLKEIIEQQDRLGVKIYKTEFHSRFDKL